MNPQEAILRLFSVSLWGVAAACLFLFVLNRRLIQMRDARSKSVLIRVGGVLSVVVAGVLGCFAVGTVWMFIPAAILAATVLGEIHRLLIRRQCRGEPPVAAENAGVSWRTPITTMDLAVFRYEIQVPAWRGAGLRIAHVSDFHINSHLPLTYYADVMQRVAAAEPDLIFMTGDFVTHPQCVDLLPKILSLARGRLGTFGILGNHDYWADPEAVADALRAAGVTLLRDASVRVPVGDGRHILVTGCAAPWSSPAPSPIAPLASDQLALLLTHTPDNIYRLSGLGYAAIFAGHYHAGQMRIPGLGSLVVPSNYGRRFDHGHFVLHGTHLFVTAGVGSAEPPLRVWCQPDMFIVDIVGKHD